MFRHIAVFTIGLVGIANLNAAGIQIGGNTGLTSGVGGSGTSETTTGSAGSGQQPYVNNVFQGTTVVGQTSGNLCSGATISTCTSTSGTPGAGPTNEFATANGVTFALVNQNISGTQEMEWAATSTGNASSTITIPIGIFGVTSVDTMLNDEYGLYGGTPTTVTFQFANSADNVTFNLVNGQDIRDSFDCTSGSGLAACQAGGFYNGSNVDTLSSASYASNSGDSDGASVTAFNVWTGTYSGGVGAYVNTNGTLFLDAQNFYLGTDAANTTLLNVVITDTQTAVKQSRDGLSAVTVFTPEPSTMFLLATGFGALGLFRRRRQA